MNFRVHVKGCDYAIVCKHTSSVLDLLKLQVSPTLVLLLPSLWYNNVVYIFCWTSWLEINAPVFPKNLEMQIYELGHEKTCFMSYANNKGTDQPALPRSLISAFVVRCLYSVMSLVSVTKISSLMLASVAEQASLSLIWSETPKDTFFHDAARIYFLFLPVFSARNCQILFFPKELTNVFPKMNSLIVVFKVKPNF